MLEQTFPPISKQDAAPALQSARSTRPDLWPRAAQVREFAPPFLGFLVAAALVDWLITRTLTRFAIFIPKSPALVTGYEIVNWVGMLGSASAALLALCGLGWVFVAERRRRPIPWLGILYIGLGALSLVFLVLPPGAWRGLHLAYQALMALALVAVGVIAISRPLSNRARLAVWLPLLAMLAAAIYHGAPLIYSQLRLPGPPTWSSSLYPLGEGLVLAGAVALWWAYGRSAAWRQWAAAAAPALLFAVNFLAEPALTATIVIWSNGLTLVLPWWLYAGALWLTGVTVVSAWKRGHAAVTGAILLLAAAGFAPQLSSQFFFGLLALWLLIRASERGEPSP